MSIEEKAQRYDKAFEEASVAYKDEDRHLKATLERIFPELKESEDERIRKALIHLVNSNKELSFGIDNYDGIKWGDILAWIEKQGEQRSDIGISSTTKQKLKDNLNKALQKETCDSWNEFLDEQNPMTGSKFKVGDKVVHKGTGKTWTVHWYIKEDNTYSVEDSEGLINIYSPDVLEPIEQKPAWSEEDESHIRYLIECLEYCKKGVALTMSTSTAQEYINWLKSLRPQNRWRPTEEMLEALGRVIPENVMEISEDEMLLSELYQGLKYGRVLSKD